MSYPLAKAKLLAISLLLIMSTPACFQEAEIIVTPPNKVSGVAYVYAASDNILKYETITLHEISEDNSLSDTSLETEKTSEEGSFIIRYPRHMGPDPRYILKMDSATIGYMPLYAVASQANVKINLFSTVIYDLITKSQMVKLRDFTNEQLQQLQNKAEELFNQKLQKGYIQLDGLSIQSIYTALQNSIESSNEFMAMYDNFSAKIVSAEIPFGKTMRNEAPQLLYRQPFNLKPNIYESNQMNFEINSADPNGDIMFYVWSINGVPMQKGGYFYIYSPGFDVVTNGDTYKLQEVSIEVSDGGFVQTQTWDLTVFNKNRAPIVSNVPNAAAKEDTLFSSTIEVTDQDGDYPLTLTMQSGPAGMNFAQITDRTAVIDWTPSNCQVGNNNVVFILTDSQGLSRTYNLVIKVADPNLPPSFLPLSCNLTATEASDWVCDLVVTDPDMIPVASGGTLNDGCADIMGFSFLTSPVSAKITKTAPDTARITWRPKDNETGLQTFKIQLDDSHGAQVVQTFQVITANIDQRPVFFLNVVPGSYQDLDIKATTPFDGTEYIRTPPVTLNEDDVCPQLDITLYVYNGDLGERLTYRIYNPDPNPNPTDLLYFPITATEGTITSGSWAAGSVHVTWCVKDSNTPNPASPVGIEVRDSNGNTDTYLMTFTLPERNQKPVITSITSAFISVNYRDSICCDSGGGNCNTIPNLAACPAAGSCYDQYGVVKGCWQDSLWTQPVQVVDPDAGDIVTCSIVTTPVSAVSVDPSSCQLSWMPHWADMNIYSAVLTAKDNVAVNPPPGQGVKDSVFSIYVQDVNYPPHITSTAPLTGSDGSQYSYTVAATDPNITDNYRKLSYSLVNAPAGMAVTTVCPGVGLLCTGDIKWTPTDAQAKTGGVNFGVKVTDNGNPKLSHTQTNHITLTDVNQSPNIDYIPTYYAGVSQTLSFLITGYDPDAGDSVTLSVASGAPTSNFSFTDQGGGVASVIFTPSDTQIGSFNITYRITDNRTASTTKVGTIEVSNKPKIISVAPVQAMVAKEYDYTVRTIAPKDAHMTYQITIGPSGMYFQDNVLKWTPSSNQTGMHGVSIRSVNADSGEYDDQTWNINVKTTNKAPTISAQSPSCASIIQATESKTFTMSVKGTDQDASDSLLYQWFIDDVWKTEEITLNPSVFNTMFDGLSSGEHIIKFVINDGIDPLTTTCATHVRNSIPIEGTSSTITGRTISSGIVNEENGKIALSTKAGSSYYLTLINDQTNLSAREDHNGCGGFSAKRLTLDNSHSDPNNYSVYLAQNGDALAGSNTFIRFFSIGSICSVSGKDKLFYNGFKYEGGSNTGYNYISTTRMMTYHVNSGNTRLIKAYNSYNATYEADIDIGANSDISSIISVNTGLTNLVFATDRFHNTVTVINPSDNSIQTTVDLSSGCQTPFAMSYYADTGELYTYCGGNGVISIINTADYSTTYITGFPTTNTSVDHTDVFHLNSADDLVYILSSQSKLAIWDLQNDTIKVLNLGKQYDQLLYDDNTNRLFLIDYETATITAIK